MEIDELWKLIKERWIKSERYELIIALEEAPQGAATGGEGVGLIWKFLIELEEKDKDAFNEIEDLVEEFIKRSRKYGNILIRKRT
ncbi:MAG TPA: hypothetical protein VII99_09240 [Bacteroidia bacterium]